MTPLIGIIIYLVGALVSWYLIQIMVDLGKYDRWWPPIAMPIMFWPLVIPCAIIAGVGLIIKAGVDWASKKTALFLGRFLR